MNPKINELTQKLQKGAVKSYNDLEQLRIIVLNLKITLAHLSNTPETRALNQIASIIENSIRNLENITHQVKEIAKEIEKENE